jgi:outer membrane protein assembly factor BamB
MKKFTIFILLLSVTTFAQSYKFAWITDSHIGFPNADAELDSVVQSINARTDISFVIASGDITEKGTNEELELAKTILDQLNIPLYIIPGNHDTKWSESGCTKFIDLWDDDRFIFEKGDDIFIGLNSGIPWKGGGGHFKPEDISWLDEQLEVVDSTKEVYFVVHHPLNDDIDNWFKVTNLLRDKNIKFSLNGHGHDNKISKYNGLPAVMVRSTLSKKKDSWGYTIVENTDSIVSFFEVEGNKTPQKWDEIDKRKQLDIPYEDVTEFNSYSTKVNTKIELNSTLVALPIYANNYIYTVDMLGLVSCFDSTGRNLWEYDTFGNAFSTPVVIDNYFVVGTVQGDLITLNAETGEQIQSIGFDAGVTSQLIAFDYDGPNNLMFPKETASKACVVLGTSNGKVYCYDVETLQEYWIFEDPSGMIETKPLHLNNKLIFGSWDSKIYCIDDRTGLLIWQWDEIKNFYYSPAAVTPVTDGRRVYFTSPNKTLYAIDATLGTTSWQKANKYQAWESLGISNDNRLLFVKGMQDKFHVVSAITSNWVKVVNVQYGLDTMPGKIIQNNDDIIFNAKNGKVYKIKKNYKYETMLYLGAARVHSVQKVKNNLFLASNMDGTIVLFEQ